MTAADFRLAWRLQRWEIVVLVGGSLLMAAAMAAVAWQLAVNRDAIAACYAETGPSLSADCRSTIGLGNFLGSSVAVLVGAATVAPFAVGVLIGAPLLSREIEHRTAPMAWSLAQSRRRWLVGRVLPGLVLIGVALLLLGQASELLLTTVQEGELGFMHFGQHGPILAMRGLAVYGIGVMIGLVGGRVLPAVLVTAMAAIVLVGGASIVRDQLMRAEAEWFPANSESDVFAMIYDSRLRDDATGEIFTYDEVMLSVSPEEIDPMTGVPAGWTQLYLAVDPEKYGSFVVREIAGLAGVTVLSLALGWVLVAGRRPE